MTLATVGARYQVVIPAPERRRLGVKPRDKVSVESEGDAVVIRSANKRAWRGIASEVYDGRNAVAYVRELRSEWGSRR
jgi:AbrB family looped-hinge helix DNA binding protein